MKKRIAFIKTLLVAALLGVGSSAWAGVVNLYSQNYESAVDASSWNNYSNSILTLKTGDATYGKYINQTPSGSGNRSAYSDFGATMTGVTSWRLEWDMKLVQGLCAERAQSSFAIGSNSSVYTSNGTSATNTYLYLTCDQCPNIGNVGAGKNVNSKNRPTSWYFLTAVGGTKLAINGGSDTDFTLSASAWYHYIVTLSSGKVTVTIMNSEQTETVATVSYTTSIDAQDLRGFFSCVGRSYGSMDIDNIILTTESDDEFVGDPTINIEYAGATRNVTITSGTSSEGNVVTTYYTTDGSDPTASSNVYTEALVVTEECTVKAISISSGGAESSIVSQTVNVGMLTLNAPSFSRSGNTVTISNSQTNIVGNPTGTLYVKYNSDEFTVSSGTITVGADATISAYVSAENYNNSSTVTRDVALFPAVGVTQIENSPYTIDYTTSAFSDETTTTDNATYAALMLTKDEKTTQWGTNIYLQTSGWGIRNNGGWYTISSSPVWILIKSLKAGDIIVAQLSKAASGIVNATYSEKYSRNGYHAYIVNNDGDVELGFTRVSSKENNYFSGIYAYTHNVNGSKIGAFDNTTAYMEATSDKVTLKPGESYRYQFKNYNSGGNGTWNNYLLAAYDDNDVVKAVVRADNFEVVEWKNTGCTNDFDWANFVTKMNGATVDMTVSYSTNNVLSMAATITTNEETPSIWNYTYTSDYSGSGISLSDNIKIALSVDHAWLDILSEGMSSVTVPVANTFATYANHDYALDFTGIAGLTAYTATVEGDVVTFTPATKVPAGTGLLLKGETKSVPVIASAEAVANNILYAPTTAVAGLNYDQDDYYNFILTQPTGKQVGFYRANNNNVAVGKAYLRISKEASARQFTFIGLENDGETTGISATLNDKGQMINDKFVYNLQGQRVNAPTKGLYIVNGKKVIMK